MQFGIKNKRKMMSIIQKRNKNSKSGITQNESQFLRMRNSRILSVVFLYLQRLVYYNHNANRRLILTKIKA